MKTILPAFFIILSLCSGLTIADTTANTSVGTISKSRLRPVDWARPIINTELGNFYQVSDRLYRSEQPDDEAIADLTHLGIGTVLNLRNHHSDDDEFQDTTIKLKRVPMNAGSVTEAQLLQALRIINQANTPVLVHCWHGSDRTGVVVASYRIVIQGWSKARAIDEFKNGGYGYHFRIYPNLIQLLETLDVQGIKQQLAI